MSIIPQKGYPVNQSEQGDFNATPGQSVPDPVGVKLPRNHPKKEITVQDLNKVDSKVTFEFKDDLENYVQGNNEYNIYNYNSANSDADFESLAGFLSGSRINVQYYWRQTDNNDIRTDIADNANMRAITGRQYIRILDYEITLNGSLEYTWDTEKAIAEITGSAILYPNLVPNPGDKLILNLDNGLATMFYVSGVIPKTYKANRTVYEITFSAYNHISSSDVDTLLGCVISTKFYSKENFFGGTGALLTEDSYVDSQKLKQYKRIIIDYYIKTFYDNDVQSFICQNSTSKNDDTGYRKHFCYDPYINTFINFVFPYELAGLKSRQLCTEEDDNFKYTILGLLLNQRLTSLLGVHRYIKLLQYRPNRYSPFITNLLNQNYVSISETQHDGELPTYIFSNDFYEGIPKSTCDDFEFIVYKIIKMRKFSDSSMFLTKYLDKFDKLSKEEQFYRLPIYFLIIEILLKNIARKNITK